MKKTVLCFGDSNTWGHNPDGGRYDINTRWPRVLAKILGDGYDVIEEGFGGRTTVHDDPTEGGYKSGLTYLPPCIMSHNPLDIIIIMLGTNDAKSRFNMNAHTIAQGAGELVKKALQYGDNGAGEPPKVLLVAPPIIGDNIMDTWLGPIFGANSSYVSRGFAKAYLVQARTLKVDYLDASRFAPPSPIDAIHLSAEAHQALAQGIADKVRQILEG